MRLRIDLAYDGAGFRGWARQPGLRTVQGELETALRVVLRLDEVSLTCAGRTDTGVHARGQVVHVDVPEGAVAAASRRTPPGVDLLLRRLNGVLPDDVRVRLVQAAPHGFDARFSALWRRYAYRLADTPEVVDPLTRGQVLAWPRQLDLAAMNVAAATLVGEHDFAAFCHRREGATTVRTLLELDWSRLNGVAVATVRADAFCHHMVRSLVGCLLAVGEGRQPTDWPGRLLAVGERASSVAVVSPKGLTLEEVRYPPDDELEGQAALRRVVRALPGDEP